LTQNVPTSRIRGQVDDERDGANVTSGGSSDSDANDWQVNPSNVPSPAPRRDHDDAGGEVPEHVSAWRSGSQAGRAGGPVMIPRLGRPATAARRGVARLGPDHDHAAPPPLGRSISSRG
jgi:hypothetical protein